MLKEWESDTFQISVRSYKQGDPKCQIGPRIESGGSPSKFKKLGRLSLGEVKFLHSRMAEVIDVMERNEN